MVVVSTLFRQGGGKFIQDTSIRRILSWLVDFYIEYTTKHFRLTFYW